MAAQILIHTVSRGGEWLSGQAVDRADVECLRGEV